MLIKCPKCQLIYNIDDSLVKESGLKMHCHHCGEVFKAFPQDALKQEETDPEIHKKDVAEMFERTYGDNIEDLFAPELSNRPKIKIRTVQATVYKHTVNWLLILFILALIGALLYFLRYDVVRYVPKAESFYQKFGIESVMTGNKLHLEKISTKEFVSNNLSHIRIKGVISNPSEYTVNIPLLKVTCYGSNGEKLSETTHRITQTRTYPHFSVPFEIVLMNPTPEKKNIQITFTNQKQGE